MPGNTFRYLYIQHISDTLYGQVSLQFDTKKQCNVAVKSFDLQKVQARRSTANIPTLENMQGEIDAMALLSARKHPHLVHLFDNFVQNQQHHLVVTHCPYGDLYNLMMNSMPEKKYPEKVALRLFAQIVEGVSCIHDHGLVHRDLSLENIMLDHEGNARVGDFGVCTSAWQTCHGQAGKAFYMAYEVYSVQEYSGPSVDVWSLGIMLFIMLTGEVPFKAAKWEEPRYRFFLKHGIRSLMKLWRFTEKVSEEAIDLLEKLLQHRSSDRVTVAEIKTHPWILKKHPQDDSTAEEAALGDARKYVNTCEEDDQNNQWHQHDDGDENGTEKDDSCDDVNKDETIISEEAKDVSTRILEETPTSGPNFFRRCVQVILTTCSDCETRLGVGALTRLHRCDSCHVSCCIQCIQLARVIDDRCTKKVCRRCK